METRSTIRWKTLTVISLVVLLHTKLTEQRGDGAPQGACENMTPQHGGIQAQASVPPYTVSTSGSQVRQGDTLIVTISSPTGAAFGGFLLQARGAQNQEAMVGTFINIPSDIAHLLNCRGANDSVTHNSPTPKVGIQFEWQAPTNFLGAVIFRATVAEGYSQFWRNIDSNLVEVVTPDTVIATEPPTTTSTSTTPSPTSPTDGGGQEQTPSDPIYNGCDTNKLCYGSVEGCVQRGNCPAIVAVFVAGDTYTFELQAINNPAYVAAGLSNDRFMGDDSGMECQQVNGRVTLHSSWTYPKVEPYVTREDVPQDILRIESSSYNNGKLYCKFTRNVRSTVKNVNFDLAQDKYHLMIVAGSSLKEGNRVGFHNLGFVANREPISLSSVGVVQGPSKLLLRLHGCFMVFAWIGSASCGIFLARYFRQTWVGKQLGGKDIWFAWHRIFMVLTWLLTMAGFILILIEAGGWAGTDDNPHAIIGLVTVILCFLQPIGAYFRPHPNTPKRPIFNWAHWFGGNAAHILGIVTIFFAVYLIKAELPGWSIWILVAFVIFHVVMHLALSIMTCISDGRISTSRVNSFPMKDMNARQSAQNDRKMDAPHSGFRKFMLGIYFLLIILFVVGLICIVALAPIEKTYEEVSSAIKGAMGTDDKN